MKLFRINKIEEFFNSFPRANDIYAQAEKAFNNRLETGVKKLELPPQMNFDRVVVPVIFTLQSK